MDFGFVGAAYTAQSITQDDQELVNWYPEVDPMKHPGNKEENVPGDRGVIALYPCPGLISRLLPAVAEVRGMRTLPGGDILLAVVGNTLYSIDTNYVATSRGTLVSYYGPVFITDNGTSAYITDGLNRYYYTWATATFATVTDGPFNGGSGCDNVDNYMVYAEPESRNWGCTDVSSITSSALNLGQKLSASDDIMQIIVDHREVLLIGEKTTERWTNVGAFPFPFQILAGTTIQHGCVAAASVARLGESLAWLSQDTRGQAIVVHAVSYVLNRISTHAIENDINTGVVSDAIAFTYQDTGHEFYVLTFPTQDKTWVYDLSASAAMGQPIWHKRAWRRAADNTLHRHRANCSAVFNGEVLVGDYENGNIYAFSRTTYTDNGDYILRRRRTPHVTSDLNRVFHHSLQIQFQPGVGLSTGQGSDPQALLTWSDDGGFTWSNEYRLPIGMRGKYKNRCIKRGLGEARDRVYNVDVIDPINAVVVSANLVTSAGAA